MLINRKRDFTIFLGIVFVVVLMPFAVGEYYRYLIRLICVYTLLALGLNIFMGFTGQINLGSAGFFCIGAYGATLLVTKLGLHYFVAMPVAGFLTVVAAWGMSYPLLRLRGHAMAIGTLAFAMAIFLVAARAHGLTGGENGIVSPPVVLFGQELGGMFFYYFILAITAAGFIFCHFLVNSRIGRALKAIRDNEAAAEAVGIDVVYYKRFAWLISAGFGGVAGSLFGQQSGFLGPETFALWTNILALVMICVGGMGHNIGAVIGAAIMTTLPYLVQGVAGYVLLLQAQVLFLVLRFLPGGVVGAAQIICNRRLQHKNEN
jgi:branched-chain amino acid transport system permease protein